MPCEVAILVGFGVEDAGVSEAGWLRLWREVVLRDPCAYCFLAGGRKGGGLRGRSEHVDHIVARARGGEDRWENFTGACRACNAVKSKWSLLAVLAAPCPRQGLGGVI